jgi:hypothetical protein
MDIKPILKSINLAGLKKLEKDMMKQADEITLSVVQIRNEIQARKENNVLSITDKKDA